VSVKYKPVIWNANKAVYDVVIVGMVVIYILVFLKIAPLVSVAAAGTDVQIQRMRAFGSCAFLLLTVVLSIGPAARLDPRFLPLVYNRRHLGVVAAAVALTHASFVFDWYFDYAPVDPYAAVLGANTSYGRLLGFPFEAFGIFALLVLLVMAVTSHDFWLNFLTPPLWKAIHMLVYAAYAAVVAHVAFGALQDGGNHAFKWATFASVTLVTTLHVLAAQRDRRDESAQRRESHEGTWLSAGDPSSIPDGRARILQLENGDKIAIFRNGDRLSGLANACAHQNGPLGEGRIVSGCVTCPWHGYQYRPEDGCSPAPFTEKVATFRLKLDKGELFVDTKANAPGTYVEPIVSQVSYKDHSA
jgi:DMSO/TMAO reductase YedYZ heme-binding membrane subunit/nitrite reductase/ring-hydroxylating ferredoxin subunit